MRATPSANSFRPAAERLEARDVPAFSVMGSNFWDLSVLYVHGTEAADEVAVIQDRGADRTSLTADDRVVVYSRVGSGPWDQGTPFAVYLGALPRISGVVFRGYGGDDVFGNYTSFTWEPNWGPTLNLPTTAVGGAGNDTLMGANARDWLEGGADNDKLYGNGGFDQLYGGNGSDYLDGGRDFVRDKLVGGLGTDQFVYEPGYGFYGPYNIDNPDDFTVRDFDSFVYGY